MGCAASVPEKPAEKPVEEKPKAPPAATPEAPATTAAAAEVAATAKVDLAEVFKKFDSSGDGYLQIDELKRAFRALGLQKRSGEKYDLDEKTFKSFDTNGDGKVSLAEFNANLHPKTRSKIEQQIASGWAFDSEKWEASVARHARWDMGKVFKAFDTDGDGSLSMVEFQRAFRAIGLKKRSGEKYEVDKAMFDSFDTNKDGTVSLEEFESNLHEKTRKKIEDKLDAGWKFDAAEWAKEDDGGGNGETAAAEPAEAAAPAGGAKNAAFVFVKPHANTEGVRKLVSEKFAEVGITVLSEGDLTGSVIDEKKHIDQHYYAIASKATILTPPELAVPADKFSEYFGEEWATVLEEGRAVNALQAKESLGCSAEELDTMWDATKESRRIKFGGGFYCGQLLPEGPDGKKLYTFNAFFMTMRGKFTAPEASIHYYSVEFDPSTLSWADFRGKVLGPTDPANAPAGSLRGTLHTDWEALGLASAPNTGDNGVHASASPFEGLAERMNWLERGLADDPFGKMLLDSGIPEDTLKAWSVDPRVPMPDGSKGSIFDALEDMDVDACAEKAMVIHKAA